MDGGSEGDQKTQGMAERGQPREASRDGGICSSQDLLWVDMGVFGQPADD